MELKSDFWRVAAAAISSLIICGQYLLSTYTWLWLQNDLEFLRIRSMKQEIMVAPRKQ